MQPHWVEPQPLGEAQRSGMFEIAGQSPPAPPQQDPRLLDKIRQERARLMGHRAPGAALGGLGAISTGALVGTGLGLVMAGAAGYYLGRKHGRSSTERKVKEAVGAKQLEGVLKNDGDDYEEYEDEIDELLEEDED